MTDIIDKIKAKIERDAKEYERIATMPTFKHATSYAIGAHDWAKHCMKLIEALKEIKREVGTSTLSNKIVCKALEVFEKELEPK